MQHSAPPHPPVATRPPSWLLAVLVILSAFAILGPLAIVRTAPAVSPAARKVVRPQRVAPKAVVPEAEPVVFQDLAPQDARAFNATVPFSTAPNPAARPFRIFGSEDDQARATDCLAAAAIYEAGDDTDGERSVVQVVLNRVRHPAFPKSVCGVVFQGQERSTGCQFTFTCDGAMMRTISPAAWERARAVATAALNGAVDKRVGHATHYHTDWVVPYWSSSLDKITEIRTHLFFRWTGWWGTPPAFNRRYAGAEPAVTKLARLSPAHAGAIDPAVLTATLAGDSVAGTPAPLPSDLVVPPVAGGAAADTVLLTLDRRLSPTQFPALAARICGDRTRCKLLAWSSKAATPAAQPLTDQQKDLMSFSYLRDRASGFERALWNCAEYKGLPAVQCMKPSMTMLPVQPALKYDATPGSVPRAIAGQVASDGPPPVTRTRPAPPEPLAGVRRRIDAVPAPKATPTPAARE